MYTFIYILYIIIYNYTHLTSLFARVTNFTNCSFNPGSTLEGNTIASQPYLESIGVGAYFTPSYIQSRWSCTPLLSPVSLGPLSSFVSLDIREGEWEEVCVCVCVCERERERASQTRYKVVLTHIIIIILWIILEWSIHIYEEIVITYWWHWLTLNRPET